MDKNCLDGKFTENQVNLKSDLTPDIAGFTPGNYQGFVTQVLQKRYKFVATLVKKGKDSKAFQTDCVAQFTGNGSVCNTAKNCIGRLGTVVHECGHFADVGMGSGGYFINPDITFPWLL